MLNSNHVVIVGLTLRLMAISNMMFFNREYGASQEVGPAPNVTKPDLLVAGTKMIQTLLFPTLGNDATILYTFFYYSTDFDPCATNCNVAKHVILDATGVSSVVLLYTSYGKSVIEPNCLA